MKIQITLTVETETKPKQAILISDLKDVLSLATNTKYSEIDCLITIDNKIANASY